MLLRAKAVTVVFALAFGQVAFADEISPDLASVENYAEAIDWLWLSAQVDTQDAIFFFRISDWLKTIDELRAEAEQGDASSQEHLGFRYLFGIDAPQSYAEAVKWLRAAADQDEPIAQMLIATAYAKGIGVREDYGEAAQWLRASAEQGFAPAQVVLGFAYSDGNGVEQDYTSAYAWLNVAAVEIEDAVKYREYLGGLMTANEITGAQRLSLDLWAKASSGR